MDGFLVEYFGFWEGNLSAARAAQALGITRPHAQMRVINTYMRKHPMRLEKISGRRVFPDDTHPESLVYAPSTPDALFNLVLGEKILAESTGEMERFGVPVEDVPIGAGHETHVRSFRDLYRACANRHAVSIDYVSRSGIKSYLFSPHTLIRVGPRLHFRGYLEGVSSARSGYADIVPSRALQVTKSDHDHVTADNDNGWNQRVCVTLALNRHLPQPVLDQVMIEHGGAAGGNPDMITLELDHLRKALAPYVIRETRFRWFGDQLMETWLHRETREKAR